MNILHTETLKRWGGQQNRVLTEAVGLNAKGHHAVIVCNTGSMLAARAKEQGVKVYELTMEKGKYFKIVPQIVSIIRKERIEIVSTHSSVDSWAGGIASLITGRKLIRFRHNLYPPGKNPLAKFIYAIPDRIIAISGAVQDVLVQSGQQKRKMVVIPSAVDIQRFNPDVEDLRKELDLSQWQPVIGNTSTFADVKGQEYLLRAFNMISRQIPCILLFAGRLIEPFKGRYLSHVNAELREKVIFLGHRDDIPRILKTMDVFVYPSFLEGLGTALIEAMAMEKAVAVSDIPTFREFIENGVNGVYFKAKEPEDIAEKVISLLQNKKLRQQIGITSRATVLERFSVDTMLDQTENIYKEVLDAV